MTQNTPPGDSASRPPVNVTNAAMAGEWLRSNIGSLELSGYFARGDDIVFTPREGTDGYVPPAEDGDHDGPAQVRTASSTHVSATINYTCWPYKRTDQSKPPSPARFSTDVAKDAIARPDLCPRLRPLRGVTHTPLIRADGTALSEPGYDPSSGFLYLPPPSLFVPSLPLTPDMVSWAVDILHQMVADFPWRSESDRANYFGMLLTPLIRLLCPPPYKLGIVTAPQPASGKTLLIRIMHELHGGVFRSEIPRDEAELKKQVTSILTGTTAPVVTFDNVSGVFRSSVMDGLLTSDVWTDRVLGATQETSRPNDRFWTLTGNNISIGGDLARRSLWASIDAGRPDPENRAVAIRNLPAWVHTRKGGLLAALLLLVRAWTADGYPLATVDSSDGFANWTAVVGGILANAGVAGEFAASETVQSQASSDDTEWHELLSAIREIKGCEPWTVREVLEARETRYIDANNVALGQMTDFPIVEALPGDLSARARRDGPSSVTRSFGMWLRHRAGRWAGSLTVREYDRRDNTQRWIIEEHKSNDWTITQGTMGLAGTFSRSARNFDDDFSQRGPGEVPSSPIVPVDLETGVNGHKSMVDSMLMDDS